MLHCWTFCRKGDILQLKSGVIIGSCLTPTNAVLVLDAVFAAVFPMIFLLKKRIIFVWINWIKSILTVKNKTIENEISRTHKLKCKNYPRCFATAYCTLIALTRKQEDFLNFMELKTGLIYWMLYIRYDPSILNFRTDIKWLSTNYNIIVKLNN